MFKVILGAVCALFALAAIGEIAAAEEFGDPANTRVLLAYEPTRFKNQLVEAVVEGLQEEDFYIKTVLHNKNELRGESTEDYDAVIVINSGVNSRVRPKVSSWLSSLEETEKVVLLTTYRDLGWEPKYPDGVDSITSPSKRSDIPEVRDEIIEKVLDIVDADVAAADDDA